MAVADARGLPLSVSIAEGSRHDVVLTDLALDSSFIDTLPAKRVGDKAWDSSKAQRFLSEERNIELVAPKRGGQRPSKRKRRALRRIRRRWKVERLFAWLKSFRRLACRWEHKAENYLGLLHLGCIMILSRQR
jgi:transposase